MSLFKHLTILSIVVFSTVCFAVPMKPTWSPDGNWLTYHDRIGKAMLIKMINVKTQEVIQLTDDQYWLHSPKFSHDGKYVYASGRSAQNSGIFKIDVTSKQVTYLAKITGEVMHPAPSPDGQWLAYDKQVDKNNFDLHLFNLETFEEKHLVQSKSNEYHPSWSLDSQFILLDFGMNEATSFITHVTINNGKQHHFAKAQGDERASHPQFWGENIVYDKNNQIMLLNTQHQEQSLYKPEHGWSALAPSVSPATGEIAVSLINNDFSSGKFVLLSPEGRVLKTLLESQ
ncbi:hypothetical protein [Thalassotalea ganghwensis]